MIQNLKEEQISDKQNPQDEEPIKQPKPPSVKPLSPSEDPPAPPSLGL